MLPLNVHIDRCRYRAMIGTGGIGSGSFFELNGNHTLGREESRSGHFIDRRDYCKLHIVSHYVQVLLGAGFRTLPIGCVGDDEHGRALLAEMEDAGLDMTFVERLPEARTLFSFCFIYPDGSGGNLTTDDSASSGVTAERVAGAEGIFAEYGPRGIGLAVPEVPLAARFRLIEIATRYSLYRVASFTAGEFEALGRSDIIERIDLLALNLEELTRFTGSASGNTTGDELVRRAIPILSRRYPDLALTVTDGARGSWSWDGGALTFFPALQAEAVSTAGAGDAFLGGVIAGLTAGLTLQQAQQLGTLVGSLSVTSPHTIHPGIDRTTLRDYYRRNTVAFSDAVEGLLV
jgi:sugar/nucleoside kinase (ribokinase family)